MNGTYEFAKALGSFGLQEQLKLDLPIKNGFATLRLWHIEGNEVSDYEDMLFLTCAEATKLAKTFVGKSARARSISSGKTYDWEFTPIVRMKLDESRKVFVKHEDLQIYVGEAD